MLIKPYLELVRIPGIFTAFTNILLGFFISQSTTVDWFSLLPLLVTSGFLFLAGMALNDYFDYKIDVRERPNKPLPSGKISKKFALYIGFSFLIIANIISSFVGFEAVIITIIMTILILAYDIKLKSIPIVGIINLSSIRFANVILGGSAVILNQELFIVAIPIGIFISAISIFAKIERSKYSKNIEILNVVLIIITIISVVIITHNGNFIHYVFLILFIVSIFIPFFVYRGKTSKYMQKKISYLLSIIILDAIIISAFSDISFGIFTILLYVPAYFILRQIYLT